MILLALEDHTFAGSGRPHPFSSPMGSAEKKPERPATAAERSALGEELVPGGKGKNAGRAEFVRFQEG
jgi:hypothetical protein